MTSAYEWNPPPRDIAIACPDCAAVAHFEFATSAIVDDKRRRAELAAHPACDLFDDVTWGNNRRTVVAHHAVLDRSNTARFDAATMHSSSLRVRVNNVEIPLSQFGAFRCSKCAATRRHVLDWPKDAFFSCDVRGEVLWAWNHEQAVALRDYVKSTHRDRHAHGAHAFLLHVPATFLDAKRRETIVKKLDRLLAG